MGEESKFADKFALVTPPDTIVRFEVPVTYEGGRWIDYAAHPAYSEALQSARFVDKLRSSMIFARYFLLVAFKRLIGYELIPAHLRKVSGFRRVLNYLKYGLGRRNGFDGRHDGSDAGAVEIANIVHSMLKEQGICVIGPTEERYYEVDKLVMPEVERLRHLRGESKTGGRAFIESRASVLRTENPELFGAVESLFRDCGVLDAVSAYTGRAAKVVDINPQLNDHSDDFWRTIFPDIDAPQTDTAYYHRDASGGDVKAIIYLSDVGPENGPFTFVVGSQKGKPSGVIDWFGETNDHSGFSATDKEARKSFAALPAIFRRKCAFGKDIPINSEVSRRIHAAEWKISATRGHIVVFDTKGIHRGGMVTGGERAVLTCVLG